MLVLSKMNWDVNLVIALDYLEPLQSLWPRAETVTTETATAAVADDSNELKECSVLCCRFSQSAKFRAEFSPQTLALAVWHKSIPPDISTMLGVSHEMLDQCTKRMFGGATITTTTPTVSPFKVAVLLDSTSTPKSSRVPLRDSNIEAGLTNIRRRLTSLTNSISEDKENNDSAIGLMNTSARSSTNSSPNESKGSKGSKGSSTQSSPDSGAACKSPDIAELDQLLHSTHISPSNK